MKIKFSGQLWWSFKGLRRGLQTFIARTIIYRLIIRLFSKKILKEVTSNKTLAFFASIKIIKFDARLSIIYYVVSTQRRDKCIPGMSGCNEDRSVTLARIFAAQRHRYRQRGISEFHESSIIMKWRGHFDKTFESALHTEQF